MTLAFLLIGGCIVGLILLCYYTNAISGSNFSPAHLRELRKADEEEKQSNEETSSFQEQSNKSESKHLRVLKPELQAEYEKQKQIEREEKIKVEYEEKIKAQKKAQDAEIKRQLAKEAQDAKLQYEKLNYIGGWEKHDSLPLDKALEIGVPYQKCFVYKLSVGGSDYIGFTTQKPKKRLEQHLNSAKEGSGQKVHVALRRFGYLHEFEVISEHENEILGLVDEIINIKKHSAELNTSIGGEGNFFLVAEKESYQGEEIFFVEKNHSAEKEQMQKGKSRKAQKKHTQTEKSNLKKKQAKKSYDFAVGDEVFHKKFGIGNIMSISPSEKLEKNVLEIQFNEVGYKRISEEFVVLSDLPF